MNHSHLSLEQGREQIPPLPLNNIYMYRIAPLTPE